MATTSPPPPWKQNIPHHLAQARHNLFLQNQSTRARYHPDQPKPTALKLQQYEADQFAAINAALERRGTKLHP